MIIYFDSLSKVNLTLAKTNERRKAEGTQLHPLPSFSTSVDKIWAAPFAAFLAKSPKLGEVVPLMDLSASAGSSDRQRSTDNVPLTSRRCPRSIRDGWWESGSVGRIEAPSFLSLFILFPLGEQNIHSSGRLS